VTGGLIQQARAKDVDNSSLEGTGPLAFWSNGFVQVCEIHGEQSRVLTNRGTEKLGLAVIYVENHSREVSAFGMEEAKLERAESLNIAIAIENGERVAVF
jgi:hypothetical protein